MNTTVEKCLNGHFSFWKLLLAGFGSLVKYTIFAEHGLCLHSWQFGVNPEPIFGGNVDKIKKRIKFNPPVPILAEQLEQNQLQQSSCAKSTMELSACYHELSKGNISIKEI